MACKRKIGEFPQSNEKKLSFSYVLEENLVVFTIAFI